MKRRFIFCFFAFCMLGNSFLCYGYGEPEGISEDVIEMIAGDLKVINVDSPKRVSLRDPQVADIKKADAQEVVVIAKAKGITSLTIWDKSGEHPYIIKVYPGDVKYLQKQVDGVIRTLGFSRVYTKPIPEEGKILLIGKVKNTAEKTQLQSALGELAGKVIDITELLQEDSLVEISVEVLELARGATRTLGFTLPNTIALTEATKSASTSLKDIFKIGALQRASFFLALDALEKEGKAKILSRPQVVCQSGKQAELLVGGEVPIFTTKVASGGGEGTEVEYKEYGIKLKISPTVTDKEEIQLVLNVEVSEVGTAETIGDPDQPTAKAYPLTKRNISTQLFINDGEVLAVGGLIKNVQSEDVIKTPFLSEVPFVGAAFRHKTKTTGGGDGKEDRELFITLTPKIVSSREVKDDNIIQKGQKPSGNLPEEAFQELYRNVDIPADLQNYIQSIQRLILSRISYPRDLLNTGWEGTVILELEISEIGELKDVLVFESSGYKIFDDDAMQLVRKISYPPFPSEILLEQVKIKIPITYRAQR